MEAFVLNADIYGTAVGTAVDIVPPRTAEQGQFDSGAALDPAFRTNVIPPDYNWVICGTFRCVVYRVELRLCISQPSFEIECIALKA